MPWPVNSGWDQHLDMLNAKDYSRSMKVSIVMIEAPFRLPLVPYQACTSILAVECSYSVEFESANITPEAGDILIIPPQNWHYSDFSNGKKAWNIKFVLEDNDERFEPGIIKKTEETELLSKWLLKAMCKEQERTPERTTLIEHIVAALLDLHFADREIQGEDFDLIKQSRHFIDERIQSGEAVKVEDVAKRLSLSAPYLPRVFKKHPGISLKVYINQQRFEIAKKLLLYSRLNISETAEELGFDDVFRFSRFFKRMSGESPSHYLKNSNRPLN